MTMPAEFPYKYRAFISYSHSDARTVDWLHKALETYSLPKRLIGKTTVKGQIPTRLHPIFRDRAELASAAKLSSAVQNALSQSAALIVVCSRQAAESKWVNQEIVEFQRLGRSEDIYCVIVDGTPGDPNNECFPPALREENIEPLAADLRPEGDGRRSTRLKLIAGLTGVGLDDLILRDQRRRVQQMLFVTTGAVMSTIVMAFLALSAYFNQLEAQQSRAQAEDLVGFMLGELRQELEPVGRLDVLDSVANKAMEYFATVAKDQMTDEILMKRSVALRQIGEVRMTQGQLEPALEAFEKSLDPIRKLAEHKPRDTNIHFELGQTQFWTGYLHWQKQHYQTAERFFNDYLQTARYLIEIDGPKPKWRTEEAYAYLNLGSLFSKQNQRQKALKNFRLANSRLEELFAEYPENSLYKKELANGYSWLGGELLEFGELRKAVDVYEKHMFMLELLQTNSNSNTLLAQVAYGKNILADIYLLTADYDRAQETIDQAVSLLIKLTQLDPENIRWQRAQAIAYLMESRFYQSKGDFSVAETSIERASTIINQVSTKTDIESYRGHDVAVITIDHAGILMANNDIGGAEILIQEAIHLLMEGDQIKTGNRFEIARAYLTMGLIQQRKGEPNLARETWKKAKSTIEELMVASDRLNNLALLAKVMFYLQEQEKAKDLIAELKKKEYRGIDIDQLSL